MKTLLNEKVELGVNVTKLQLHYIRTESPLPSCFEPHYEHEAEWKAFHVKISFVCIWMKTNFHNKNLCMKARFDNEVQSNLKMAYCYLQPIFFQMAHQTFHWNTCRTKRAIGEITCITYIHTGFKSKYHTPPWLTDGRGGGGGETNFQRGLHSEFGKMLNMNSLDSLALLSYACVEGVNFQRGL